MAKTIEILEYLKKYPVFDSLTLNNKLKTSKEYTNLFLNRLVKKNMLHRIERNAYTLYDDPFLIASRISWPSYISCWSALKFHNLTEQIPHNIGIITTHYKKPVKFLKSEIIFITIKTKNFFGYEKFEYNGFDIFVADPEKSIIDSILFKKVSFSEIREIISNNINTLRFNKFLRYLIRINNKALIKRFGFLLESLGKNYYKILKKYISGPYTPLDYSKKPIGNRNEKWRIIIND